MALSTCSMYCNFPRDNHCELTGVFESGLPVICPYRQFQESGITPGGMVSDKWENLPGNFTTRRHRRHPGGTTTPVYRRS